LGIVRQFARKIQTYSYFWRITLRLTGLLKGVIIMISAEDLYADAVGILYQVHSTTKQDWTSSYSTEKKFKPTYPRIETAKFVEHVIPQYKGKNNGS
jgi:hypothetical protein